MPSRLVVVEQVIHFDAEGNPTEHVSSFTHELESDEQPYVRLLTIGEKWQPLETGWVERCGTLIVVNHDKTHKVTIGAGAGIGNAGTLVVMSFSFVSPGRSARFEPDVEHVRLLYVRSLKGPCKITIKAFPE